jgi:hypothetical protein
MTIPTTSDFEEHLSKALNKVWSNEHRPLRELAFALVAVVVNSGASFRTFLPQQSDDKQAHMLLLVCFEYMYLFLFATACMMNANLPASTRGAQIEKLQAFVITLTVEAFLHSIADERKQKLRNDIANQMRLAHEQYQSEHPEQLAISELKSLQGVFSKRLASLFDGFPPAATALEIAIRQAQEMWIQLAVKERIPPLASA